MSNAKIKKQNGITFTPEHIVRFMVTELFSGNSITGKEKILDTGCGEGIFSVVAAQEFSRISGKSVEKVIEENIFFIDISKKYVEKTKHALQEISHKKISSFNGITDDFCFHEFSEPFDYIVGNPPYVRIQHLNDRREKLQKKYVVAASGSIDLYFCFFERGIDILKENGSLAFITPNSHFHSSAGSNLRKLLLPLMTKVIDFGDFQAFKDVTTYTAITFLKKGAHSEALEYVECDSGQTENCVYKQVSKKNISLDKWMFLDDAHVEQYNAMRTRYSTLHEIADIHYGIATLKDDVYIFAPDAEDESYVYRGKYKMEKDACVPIIKASTYKGVDQNLFLLFPYENGRVIPESIFQVRFPEAYRYFSDNKKILESRDKGKGVDYEVFYAFGRNQGLVTSFGKKIITSTMNQFPRFFVIEDPKYSFYAGYCVKPKYDSVDLHELCSILNSGEMKTYIDATSKKYQGGYKSYAKSFLKDFTHPAFCNIRPTLF